MPARSIAIANRHPRLRLDRRAVTRALQTLDAHFAPASLTRNDPRRPSSTGKRAAKILRCPPGELSVVFLTDAALAQLHQDFLDDPTTTDVITFEGDPALGTAGEICVSVDTALAYAKEHRRDFSAELTLYLVHGWLHLAGYDDLQPAKKRLMRRAETRALKTLSRHCGCLPAFALR